MAFTLVQETLRRVSHLSIEGPKLSNNQVGSRLNFTKEDFDFACLPTAASQCLRLEYNGKKIRS